MVTFVELRDFDPLEWRAVAGDWSRLAQNAEEAADAIYERGTAALDEHWTDEVGERARAGLEQLANDYQVAAAIMRAVVSTLEGFEDAITPLRRLLHSAVDFATAHDLVVSDFGWVSYESEGEDSAEWARQANDLIQEALRSAAAVDTEAREELYRLTAAVHETDLREALDVVQQHASENQIQMMREALPIGEDSATVAAWWDSLTPHQRLQFERAVPVDLYDLDGIPEDVKDRLRGSDGYDRIAMVRWAQQNWDNTNIDVFDNNCANFVSHALAHGGMDERLGPWGTLAENSWGKGAQTGWDWFDEHVGSHTDTWYNSDAQRNFLLGNGGEEVPAHLARPGDIIYFEQVGADESNPPGEIHHAAVVTSVTPDGDIHYTQHTSSRLDASLDGRLHDIEVREGEQRIVIVRPRQTW